MRWGGGGAPSPPLTPAAAAAAAVDVGVDNTAAWRSGATSHHAWPSPGPGPGLSERGRIMRRRLEQARQSVRVQRGGDMAFVSVHGAAGRHRTRNSAAGSAALRAPSLVRVGAVQAGARRSDGGGKGRQWGGGGGGAATDATGAKAAALTRVRWAATGAEDARAEPPQANGGRGGPGTRAPVGGACVAVPASELGPPQAHRASPPSPPPPPANDAAARERARLTFLHSKSPTSGD
jgi:hypothetical protein